MKFVFRYLHSDDWQPHVTTVSLCLWSHVHAEWTLTSTHYHCAWCATKVLYITAFGLNSTPNEHSLPHNCFNGVVFTACPNWTDFHKHHWFCVPEFTLNGYCQVHVNYTIVFVIQRPHWMYIGSSCWLVTISPCSCSQVQTEHWITLTSLGLCSKAYTIDSFVWLCVRKSKVNAEWHWFCVHKHTLIIGNLILEQNCQHYVDCYKGTPMLGPH